MLPELVAPGPLETHSSYRQGRIGAQVVEAVEQGQGGQGDEADHQAGKSGPHQLQAGVVVEALRARTCQHRPGPKPHQDPNPNPQHQHQDRGQEEADVMVQVHDAQHPRGSWVLETHLPRRRRVCGGPRCGESKDADQERPHTSEQQTHGQNTNPPIAERQTGSAPAAERPATEV